MRIHITPANSASKYSHLEFYEDFQIALVDYCGTVDPGIENVDENKYPDPVDYYYTG